MVPALRLAAGWCLRTPPDVGRVPQAARDQGSFEAIWSVLGNF